MNIRNMFTIESRSFQTTERSTSQPDDDVALFPQRMKHINQCIFQAWRARIFPGTLSKPMEVNGRRKGLLSMEKCLGGKIKNGKMKEGER
jgi:hypothetical protein